MALQRLRRGVEGAPVDGDGVPRGGYPAAHLGQLAAHGLNAVGFLDAQPSRVADDGGAAAKAPHGDEYGPQVGAVGQVDLHPVEQAALKAEGAVGLRRELGPAPAQDFQNHLRPRLR